MPDLREITIEGEGGGNEGGHTMGEDSTPRERDLNGPTEDEAPTQGLIREPKDGGLGGQSADHEKTGAPPARKDFRTPFYELYRKEAAEYDKEFMQKHGEDLNTTLIFAGLFSAVTSAFIIQVQPQLQSDPNEETAALLRVLIHKVDNTTFGGDAPALPQWAGPPQAIIHTQCLLYASLFASLLAAFLAMLGKQWLNKYDSIDLRGSAIERSQDRQRKLNGINAWYFDQVIESLPVMLQAALLLLGCALSKYLWEVNTTVAAVVVGVTSFGVLFYLFIVVAGTASLDCPYQTPLSNLIRRSFRSARSLVVKHSSLHCMCSNWWSDIRESSGVKTICYALLFLPALLTALVFDIVRPTFWISVKSARRMYAWWVAGSPRPDQVLDSRATELDCHCVSWILQTSSDITIKDLTVNFLGTIQPPPGLSSSIKSTILVSCFDAFNSFWAGGNENQAPIASGLEQTAETSALSFLAAYSSAVTTEPTSAVVEDVRNRYEGAFPSYHRYHPYPIRSAVHGVFHWGNEMGVDWRCYNPPNDELIAFSRALAQVTQYNCRTDHPSIPHWLTQFAFRFLSQKPLPPTSVVVDCLTLIVTDLKCNVPDAEHAVRDANATKIFEKARLEQLFNSIIRKYEGITSPTSLGGRTTVIAFLSYVFQCEENGTALPIWLKYATLGVFQYRFHFVLGYGSNVGDMMQCWIAAASELPDTRDVRDSVVKGLLQMASQEGLWPYIPVAAWEWLKKRPVLRCETGLFTGCGDWESGLKMVQTLGDIELITSYLFVIWSEWNPLTHSDCEGMQRLIREELNGIHAVGYRADLIQRLDYVLSQFDRGHEYLRSH